MIYNLHVEEVRVLNNIMLRFIRTGFDKNLHVDLLDFQTDIFLIFRQAM